MKRESKILIAIFIFALLIRIIFVFSSPVKWWDEAVYANLGFDLAENPLSYSFNHGWSDFVPGGGGLYSWPNAGFRAPLLPYTLMIFYFLRLNFLVLFLMPFLGALSVVFTYILGKKFFSKEAGLYSALFLALTLFNVYYGGKILTDVFVTFFIVLAFFIFWRGFEEQDKKYKILFGFFFALSLLARYTALWIMPVFLIYFIIRDKSLRFLKDKYLWYAILVFLLVLMPWMVYGYFTYRNPLGAFIHGMKASSYWGGVQSWSFFFQYWKEMFSIIAIVFVFSLIYIIYKRQFIRKEIYLLLLWILLFFGVAMLMPHKEDRFILPIVPAICLICGFFIAKIKKCRRIVLILIIAVLLLSLSLKFYIEYKNSYTETNICFSKGNTFLRGVERDSLIITDESPLVYYYTKRETGFYPNPWSVDSLRNLASKHSDKKAYVFFTDYDMPLDRKESIQIKKDLDANFEKVFECLNRTFIYKYS